MKKLNKKSIRFYDIHNLIDALNDTQKLIHDMFPDKLLDFNFIGYFKKQDTDKMRNIKEFIILFDNLFVIIQEFRSRGYSLLEVSDFENSNDYLLRKSFKEKQNAND